MNITDPVLGPEWAELQTMPVALLDSIPVLHRIAGVSVGKGWTGEGSEVISGFAI